MPADGAESPGRRVPVVRTGRIVTAQERPTGIHADESIDIFRRRSAIQAIGRAVCSIHRHEVLVDVLEVQELYLFAPRDVVHTDGENHPIAFSADPSRCRTSPIRSIGSISRRCSSRSSTRSRQSGGLNLLANGTMGGAQWPPGGRPHIRRGRGFAEERISATWCDSDYCATGLATVPAPLSGSSVIRRRVISVPARFRTR